jgi:5-methylcytosine-specific restriction endonuclease McrA
MPLRKMNRTLTPTEAAGRRESSRTRWTRKTLLRKHAGRCYLCGEAVELRDPTSPRYATLDHVVALSRGGRDTLANLALACRRCNEEKGSSR